MSMRRLIHSLTLLAETKKHVGPSDDEIMNKWFGKEHLDPLKGGQTYLKKSYFASKGMVGPSPLGELGVAFWASDKSDYGRAEREDNGVEHDPKAWFVYLSKGFNGRFLKKIWSRLEYSEYSSPKFGEEQLSVGVLGKDKLTYNFHVVAGKNDIEFRDIRTEKPNVDWRFTPRGKATVDEMMDAVG